MRGGEAVDEATPPKFSPAGTSYYSRSNGKLSHHWGELVRRFIAAFTWFYQRVIVALILREKKLASSDGRHIPMRIDHESPLLDPRRGHSYIPNTIRTSRYTIWDFVPKQLLFQFTRVGNFYFLCVGIPQMIPGLSTTGSYTTILPLMFFVLVTIFKEGYDDYKRHKLDKVENANFATVLGREDKYTGVARKSYPLDKLNPFRSKNASQPPPVPEESHEGVRWVPTRWRDIQVGHVIRLSRDEPVPADLILIHSDGENGLAYIETMALDGETNLKSKQVAQVFENCDSIAGISRCHANFVLEDPNPDLHSFDGRVSVGEKQAVPLTINEVVYRGSILRNTTCAIGVVVNTGEECKIRMNSNKHPSAKKPALESVNNKIVLTLATYVVLLAIGVSMGYIKWQHEYEHHAWYLSLAKVPFHQIIIAFIIMFNNVVPLALYVSLEIVKVGQLLMLNSDINMYDEETDTPARCNTNTILEDLGQIKYIFSDKTGTLTNNVMKFRKISIAGTVWLHEMDLQIPESESMVGGESSYASTSDSVYKTEPVTLVVPDDHLPDSLGTPITTPRPSIGGGRRSSSHWRSTGRPDHVQPEVNTEDLLEYIRLRPYSGFSRKARDYLLAMALCHTCLPELRDGKIEYQASSPDELALVKAARELGYSVVQRNSTSITLRIADHDGMTATEEKTYKILDVIEFSSMRKRMSMVVRYPDGRIAVICKGADSAILPRLKMSSLAMQKAHEIRESADLEHERFRRSEHQRPRNNLVGPRPSLTIRRNPGPSVERRRFDGDRSKSFEAGRLIRPSGDRLRASISAPRGASFDIQKSSLLTAPSHHPAPLPERFSFLDGSHLYDESESFSKCFQHLEEFATEGLRTLLYAQRFISEAEYQSWKKVYDEATTSLQDRQERIEKAGELIEQSFDLVGATAIEDKLQKGVPQTIDRLRRANIKIWMLTGDKRETAINIAHSTRICRPDSDIYILDVAKGTLHSQIVALNEDLQAGSVHSVVVIDGQTLAAVEASAELSYQFYAVMVLVDSVICCRASPAQKALLVRAVRSKLQTLRGNEDRGLTLAIGDGANDLAMIQASHVGVGISGKEGLQAARVADYSIAQFRFLQRLLLVHGRWNYVRTAKFIVCTYWKEMFFYLPTAQYQRYNGYTGTSLYEAASLTVFNTLFTSLCTICMGIWEQDLQAETLLAIPELYVFGQRSMGLNLWNYVLWMLLAAIEGVICWYGAWAGYGWIVPSGRDSSVYALGTLVFTIGVFWINWKLFIFETHYKTTIVMFSFFLTTWGWFAWNAFLSGVYEKKPSGAYAIRDSFTQTFGRDPTWWSTLFLVLSFLGLMELVGKVVKRQLKTSGLLQWPPKFNQNTSSGNMEDWDLETWQEMEQKPEIKRYLARLARDDDDEDDIYDDFMEMEVDDATDLPGEKNNTFREQIMKLGGMIPLRLVQRGEK